MDALALATMATIATAKVVTAAMEEGRRERTYCISNHLCLSAIGGPMDTSNGIVAIIVVKFSLR